MVPAVENPQAARAAILSGWLRGKKPDTIKAYSDSIRAFGRWWSSLHGPTSEQDAVRGLLQVGRLQANALLQAWFADQLEASLSIRTVKLRYAALRSLCTLMVEQLGEGTYVPRATLPKGDRAAPLEHRARLQAVRPAYAAIIERLEALAAAGDAAAVRDLLVFRLGRGLGLRRMELSRLNVGDVDLDHRLISISGKGRIEKEKMPLPSGLAARLREHLASGDSALPTAPLLCARNGRRLDRMAISRIIARRAHEAGVKLRPHDKRRLFCTRVIEKFGLRRGRLLTRHATEATLSLYDLSAADELEAMAEAAAEEGED